MLFYKQLEPARKEKKEKFLLSNSIRKSNPNILFNFSVLFLISSTGVTLCILPIIYAKLGFRGFGELGVAVYFFSSIPGTLIHQTIIRFLNYRLTVALAGLAFLLTPIISMVISSCGKIHNEFYCSRDLILIINILGMSISGFFGPTAIIAITSYLQIISDGKESKKNLFMIIATFFCSHTIGLSIASFILHLTNPHLVFLIISIGSIFFITMNTILIQNIEKDKIPVSKLSKKIECMINVIKHREGIHLVIYSFFNGIFQSNFIVILYRLLLPSLVGVHKSKKELYELGSMVLFGAGGLIITIVCFVFFRKKNSIWFLGVGYFFVLTQTIIMNLALFFSNAYLIIAIAYLINGIALAFLKVSLLTAIFENEDHIMEMVMVFRLSHCLGIACGSLIGYIFNGFQAVLIFSFLHILILSLCLVMAKYNGRMLGIEKKDEENN